MILLSPPVYEYIVRHYFTAEVEYAYEPEEPDRGDTIPDADTDPVPEPDPEGD